MCENPIKAYARRFFPLDSKVYFESQYLSNPYTKLRFKMPHKNTNQWYELQLPCGWCLECRLKKAKEWSTRCYLENKLHQESCFITCTYAPQYLPKTKDGRPTLCVKHFQDFMKRLKKKYPDKKILRFYCGEYGEKKGRPHYHAILFGYEPKDLIRRREPSNRGHTVYNSKELNKIWGLGRVVIGKVTAESSGYVARYTMKKAGIKPEKRPYYKWQTNPKWLDWRKTHKPEDWKKNPYRTWLKPIDENEPKKEFLNASKRPAIGKNYFLQHFDEIINTGNILVYCSEKVQIRNIPKYFINIWQKIDIDSAMSFKIKQILKNEADHKKELEKNHLTEEEWRENKKQILHRNAKKLIRNENDDNNDEIIKQIQALIHNVSNFCVLHNVDKCKKNT